MKRYYVDTLEVDLYMVPPSNNFSYMHNQTLKADRLSQLQGTAENGFKRLMLGEVQGLISDV